MMTKKKKHVPTPNTTFKTIWDAFGKNIKVGCVEDSPNRDKIAKVIRFVSTYKDSSVPLTTLDEYIARMTPSQKDIYYIANENYDAALNSPYMQFYKKKGFEVLILNEPLDEPCVDRIQTYEGKRLVSIEKSPNEPEDTEEEKIYKKRVKKAFTPLTKLWGTFLKKKVNAVNVSHRLVEDPAVISSVKFGTSAFSDRIARTQMFSSGRGGGYEWVNRYLDINPNHPLIKKMLQLAKDNPDDPQLQETALVVYDTALFSSGFVVDDPSTLSRRIYQYLKKDIGISETEKVENYELSPEEKVDDPEDETKKKTHPSDENIEENLDEEQENEKNDDEEDNVDDDVESIAAKVSEQVKEAIGKSGGGSSGDQQPDLKKKSEPIEKQEHTMGKEKILKNNYENEDEDEDEDEIQQQQPSANMDEKDDDEQGTSAYADEDFYAQKDEL